jgi:hypothetical protein
MKKWCHATYKNLSILVLLMAGELAVGYGTHMEAHYDASAKAPADDDEDDELDPEAAGMVDLIGQKFFISGLLDTHARIKKTMPGGSN